MCIHLNFCDFILSAIKWFYSFSHKYQKDFAEFWGLLFFFCLPTFFNIYLSSTLKHGSCLWMYSVIISDWFSYYILIWISCWYFFSRKQVILCFQPIFVLKDLQIAIVPLKFSILDVNRKPMKLMQSMNQSALCHKLVFEMSCLKDVWPTGGHMHSFQTYWL